MLAMQGIGKERGEGRKKGKRRRRAFLFWFVDPTCTGQYKRRGGGGRGGEKKKRREGVGANINRPKSTEPEKKRGGKGRRKKGYLVPNSCKSLPRGRGGKKNLSACGQ